MTDPSPKPDEPRVPAAPKRPKRPKRSFTASDIFRWALTAVVVLIWVWWLFIVSGVIGTIPTKDKTTGLETDPYGRAKEILALVIPVVTLVLGYWFGVKGADQATQTATAAVDQAKTATDQADTAKAALAAVGPFIPEAKYIAYLDAVKNYPGIVAPPPGSDR
jgi:hypothetical protein